MSATRSALQSVVLYVQTIDAVTQGGLQVKECVIKSLVQYCSFITLLFYYGAPLLSTPHFWGAFVIFCETNTAASM